MGQLGFAVLVAGFAAVSPGATVELVPDRLLCTVLSVGYNLGFGILGGLTLQGGTFTPAQVAEFQAQVAEVVQQRRDRSQRPSANLSLPANFGYVF